eukprot:PRCOL_00004756-RA
MALQLAGIPAGEQRTKLDGGSDRDFYAFPRFVKHVDDAFLSRVTQLYDRLIPEGACVLDLQSSWVSHLPESKGYERVVAHGLNAQELERNSQATTFFVRDLNAEPALPALKDDSFDAVVDCVSVQYLQRPEAVFAEINRVLKPGGVAIFTFSNRQFYSKAISAWRDGTGFSRVQLVKSYFSAVDGFTPAVAYTEADGSAVPKNVFEKLLWALKRGQGDPFYAVVAWKEYRPDGFDTHASS